MAGSQNNYWGQHELNRVCFGLNADMDHSLKELQQQQTAKEFNSNISLFLTSDNFLLHHEGDQVVPSSQRRAAFGGRHRESKPLPPLPDPEELMSDEAADSEVEFFTSDRRRLLPKSCPKPVCRGSRDCGQVNYAYQESSLRAGGAGIAFSWPSREEAARRGRFGANNWLQRDENQHEASANGEPLKDQPSRDRFSCSDLFPADKPQVPPRIPIPPKPAAFSKTSHDDKPPKIPPRVPLVPPCPPRTPSPKCLPIYINGVMPATQSFAANPEYVSKALQRQQSERAPPPAQFTPCIVPILKDGRQASATHYILLPPGRPPHTDRRDRLMSEPIKTGHGGAWQKR
ncbi:ERBB receptor feedback inhibitor 1 isoform X1 [Acanthochromis polyacanthus]|uniref:ERBB receptor feedback inhibitor 1 isoform X1 n=2 Tax=Acanthochromis polyacanthus TaxID=80966 RepID=UPI000B900460|nr:ERBB receptor feedback inhibitor 1 isoform X1 [Acanthochromis polyacanthus]XP_022054481.1 ERBB receptor feedback inhibitor 1 isoform X1 [Acanthochromis polyacanthus]